MKITKEFFLSLFMEIKLKIVAVLLGPNVNKLMCIIVTNQHDLKRKVVHLLLPLLSFKIELKL